MKEVLEGRQQQLREALERNRLDQEESRLLKLEIERQTEKGKAEDTLKHESIMKKREKYSMELKDQIKDIERRRILESEAEEEIIAKEKVFLNSTL